MKQLFNNSTNRINLVNINDNIDKAVIMTTLLKPEFPPFATLYPQKVWRNFSPSTTTQTSNSTVYEIAKRYVSQGLSVIPFRRDSKIPILSWKEYQEHPPTEEELYNWFVTKGYQNLAIVTGEISGIIVIDCDSEEAYNQLSQQYDLQSVPVVKSPKGYHLYFKYDPKYSNIKSKVRVFNKIDIRTNGGCIIAPPSSFGDSQYMWKNSTGQPPLIFPTMPDALFKAIESSHTQKNNSGSLIDLLEQVETALPGKRNDTLNSVAFQIGNKYVPGQISKEEAEKCLFEAAQKAGLETSEIKNTINSGLTAGIREQENNKTAPEKPSDIQLSEMVISEHSDLCYSQRGWMQYHNGIWEEIKKNQVNGFILNTIKKNYGSTFKLTKSKLESIRTLMQANGEIQIDCQKFDSHPEIIVFQNGVLNLNTSEFSEHNKQYYATTSLDYDYDSTATAPTWMKYLNDVFKDPELIQFIQEFAGYCLAQETQHEIAVWFYGPPGGGKSTFVEGIKSMLGPKVGLLGLSKLSERFSLSTVVGKTVIVSTEQPSNFIKCSDTINSIISGEPITVEKKFKEAYEYRPYAKIMWACNELPRLPNGSNGLFRRVKIVEIPSIPKEKRDPKIKKNIIAERQGIFNWALKGYKRLNKRGYFIIPEVVELASEEYKTSNDSVAQFIDEKCYIGNDESYTVQSSLLYDEYKDWSNANGLKPLSMPRFASELKSLGYAKVKKATCNSWQGLKLAAHIHMNQYPLNNINKYNENT